MLPENVEHYIPHLMHILTAMLVTLKIHNWICDIHRSDTTQVEEEAIFSRSFLKRYSKTGQKNKEMKESLKKFREEREKLEQSETLKQARKKFENIEAESSNVLKKGLEDVKEKVSETLEEVKKTEYAKKGIEFTKDLGKTASQAAGKAAETISKSGQQISQTASFKTISQGVKVVKDEFEETTLSRVTHYRPPAKLRMRSEFATLAKDDKQVSADENTTGMVLHKDSKWYQSWQNFKDNNAYMNKVFDLKMKYDESDNILIRATRTFTDKIGSMFGSFSKSDMSEVLTEICKVEPSFDKESFLKMCEKEIIPNILEAIIRGDQEVLKDWCYEAPFNTLSHPMKEAKKLGYKLDSKVLDINGLDLAGGKIMEQGPVLVIMFHSQQIMLVRDALGNVVEGNPDKVMRVTYVWALCRDIEELNPRAAWKLLDISASNTEQFL